MPIYVNPTETRASVTRLHRDMEKKPLTDKNKYLGQKPSSQRTYTYAIYETITALGGTADYNDIRKLLPAALSEKQKMLTHEKLRKHLWQMVYVGYCKQTGENTWAVTTQSKPSSINLPPTAKPPSAPAPAEVKVVTVNLQAIEKFAWAALGFALGGALSSALLLSLVG